MTTALNADFHLFHFLGSLQHFSIATHLAINPIQLDRYLSLTSALGFVVLFHRDLIFQHSKEGSR